VKFEGCAEQLHWNEDEKMFYLRLCLSGSALQVLWDSSKTMSANKAISLLKNRFGHSNQAERFRTELKKRRQESNESLQDLYSDILKLFYLSYPKSDHSALAIVLRDAFLESMNDRQLYVRILD
jgi:hypothetical protein